MCITEYKEELRLKNVRTEGKTEMLFSLVVDGDITLERAVEKEEIELVELKKMYDVSPYASSRINSKKILEKFGITG